MKGKKVKTEDLELMESHKKCLSMLEGKMEKKERKQLQSKMVKMNVKGENKRNMHMNSIYPSLTGSGGRLLGACFPPQPQNQPPPYNQVLQAPPALSAVMAPPAPAASALTSAAPDSTQGQQQHSGRRGADQGSGDDGPSSSSMGGSPPPVPPQRTPAPHQQPLSTAAWAWMTPRW